MILQSAGLEPNSLFGGQVSQLTFQGTLRTVQNVSKTSLRVQNRCCPLPYLTSHGKMSALIFAMEESFPFESGLLLGSSKYLN